MMFMVFTQEDIIRRQELTEKMNYGTLTPQEAEELRGLLEREREEAGKKGDGAAILLIGLLLLALLYLSSKKK